MSNLKQSFLIVPGFQKCGTATLHHLLRGHPDIFVPAHKPQFFSRAGGQNYSIDHYMKLYRGCHDHKWVADTSDSYLVNHKALERLYSTLGDELTFLVMLRNPVKRIYSAFVHMCRPRLIGETRSFDTLVNTGISSLEELADDELKALKNAERQNKIYLDRQKRIWGDNYLWNFRYVYNSIYSIHIQYLLDTFPLSRFKFIVLEDFYQNFRHQLGAIYRFLDIDSALAGRQQALQKNVNFYLTLNMSRRWVRGYRSLRASICDMIPLRGTNYLFSKFENKFLAQSLPQKIPAGLEKFLADLFSEEIHHLEKIIQVDLSVWKYQN